MYKAGYVLDTSAKLAEAQRNQQHVEIQKDGVHQHSGLIESFDDDAVRINGGYFNRSFYLFKVR
ncbi:hypothetical protein [Cohnella sp. GCM10012308]|uniref:hypothetical protein n=1 Tax=Cohnella sp. GCM10012308 TaxID=3317329 RepID=UPI003623A707